MEAAMPDVSANLEPSIATLSTNYHDLTCTEVLSGPEFAQIREKHGIESTPSFLTQQPIHVEVCQNPASTMRSSLIRDYATTRLKKQCTAFSGGFTLTEFEDPVLKEHVLSISVCDAPKGLLFIDFTSAPLMLHIFKLYSDGPASEELEEECDVSAANHWMLPSAEFHGLWENLIYDTGIKQQLLRYAETTLLFSDRGVDSNIISWNRVILLHGPPGTGKTSLCKALSQKLCIRLSHRYSYGRLVEINSHSLFSKWFSESGKLVQKMFTKIQELIDDPEALVCVLIDEVESLTSARKSVMSGSEPSDAIRVVNALLTQLDQIRRYPNVMIFTTSNVTGAIDLAFVDRADIKQYIGLPTPSAIFKIFNSCIKELSRVGIITPAKQILDLRALEVMRFVENDATKLSLRLWHIARKSQGLSGRTLRKLPFLAHALHSEQSTMSMEVYMDAFEKAVENQFAEREQLEKEHQ